MGTQVRVLPGQPGNAAVRRGELLAVTLIGFLLVCFALWAATRDGDPDDDGLPEPDQHGRARA